MKQTENGALTDRIRAALADDRGRHARARGFAIIRPRSDSFRRRFPDFAASLRRTKLAALSENEQLVRMAMDRMRENGMHVYLAATPQAAVDHVLSILTRPGTVVKSKSNMGKELHLPEALARQGHSVIETDLGDRINQLGGWHGGHVLAPAASVNRGQVRDLFSRELGEPLSDDVAALVSAARRSLRHYLEVADYGLTGANAIAAETGTVCLMENEGNIRAVSSLPRVHVVVAGIHKVVPTLADAVAVIRGASMFGAGQLFGNYLSCISGPGDGVAGPAEVHVILVDGGRSRAMAAGYAEAFACINCGSCLNFCPVYTQIGDAYGGKRVGGIGTLQTALLDGPAAADRDGASLCTGCGKCRTVCPVKLNTPGLLNQLRSEAGLSPAPLTARLLLQAVKAPARLRRVGRLVRAYQGSGLQQLFRNTRLLKTLRLAGAEALLPPPVAPVPLPYVTSAISEQRATVAFFRGCLMDELLNPINTDTVSVLAENGCQVQVPPGQACCGAMHEHAGEQATAREMARRNIDAFGDGDGPIITNSGGCGALLKQYGELLADDPAYAEKARAFAARVRDLSEFLVQLGPRPMGGVAPVRVTYHESCHLTLAQGITEEPRALLRAIPGVELVEMAPREACCGSGGTWSLQHPDLAARLRDIKLEDAAATGAEVLVTANPGCLLHLRTGGRRVVHLAELLAAAYRGKGGSV
ncbi:MAG TPA: LUD domain-containing protein [Symbiobacteriaceae bacterium]|nr:LUD domain-containing protein [Symbiobacteriaceae bacterium]